MLCHEFHKSAVWTTKYDEIKYRIPSISPGKPLGLLHVYLTILYQSNTAKSVEQKIKVGLKSTYDYCSHFMSLFLNEGITIANFI